MFFMQQARLHVECDNKSGNVFLFATIYKLLNSRIVIQENFIVAAYWNELKSMAYKQIKNVTFSTEWSIKGS